MAFTLESIVPWGRSHGEYRDMFALGERELARSMLGCGDGPAAFNAGQNRRGAKIVSIDPLYAFSAEAIGERIEATRQSVMRELRRNAADYVWEKISTPDELEAIRLGAMDEFLFDFAAGRAAGRYVAGALPALPFANSSFSLALSSHFLFLYSEQLSSDFHVIAIIEMLRVADEVRIFPLLTLDGKPSPHLDTVIRKLGERGLRARRQRVDYEFQRGGNQMLIVSPA